jgi:arginyl-tRNA synthetase
MIRDQIVSAIKEASGTKEVEIEFPENEAFGDYSTNIALNIKGKNSRETAEELVSKLKKEAELSKIVEKIEIAGPGFINLWLKKDVLIDNLIQIDRVKEKYGSSEVGKGKTVVIDYSSPNIAKPFGIGHLRSTIIGQAIYNLYKYCGYEVIGDNHLGDWGTQFGKLLFKLQNLTEAEIDKLTIDDLEKLYVEFHSEAEQKPEMEDEARKWFKKLEDGDEKAKKLWQTCVDTSLKEFNRIYELLGVKIDFAFGESYYESEMRQMMEDTGIKKYLKEGEEGATIIDLSKKGINVPLMFLKGDGATTYATRDLATIKFRIRKWNPDIIIYEVGAEQTLHFRQIFAAARLLGLVKESVELVHTAHGLYLAPDGKKFSTRKGKTIKLDEVLSEAIERAKKMGNSDEKVAQEIGIGAIKYYDLMHSVQSDIIFDWERIMNLEGNSGPYLQYTVARTNSVLEKANFKGESLQVEPDLLSGGELLILRTLTQFSEVVDNSARFYSPSLLCTYLYNLAQKFNSFYNADRIIGSDNEKLRLALTFGVGQVLKNGLKLLGISSPEKM